jgi:hypothetical protein
MAYYILKDYHSLRSGLLGLGKFSVHYLRSSRAVEGWFQVINIERAMAVHSALDLEQE